VPWIHLYLADDHDVAGLCAMLAADEEIALVVPDGPGRWRATREFPGTLRDGRHSLWHVPSGAIELESNKPKVKPKRVRDPFKGWAGRVPQFEARDNAPWFGPGPVGIIWLTIRRSASSDPRAIGRSDFNWIGNEYRTIGYPAPEATERWWRSLRRRIAKVATPVSSSGAITIKPLDVFAFPSALSALRAGRNRAANP
jgi:hypothetical protein